MEKITITTSKKKQIVDITDKINKVLVKSKAKDGLCHLFLPHSTAGLTTACLRADKELDLIDALDVVLPHHTIMGSRYEHSHIPSRLPDHIISSFFGTSLAIPVASGKLALGEFQRIVFVELNGPRKRTVLLYYD